MRPLRLPFKAAKAVWKDSWTKAWGYTQIGSGLLLGGLSELNNYLSNDTVSSYLHMMSVPNWVFIGIAVLGLITYLAHGRE